MSLLVPGIASASTAPGAENRVWAFDFTEQVHVGRAAALTPELHRGCEPCEYDLASDPFIGLAANMARLKRGAGICGKGGKAAKGGAKTPIGRRGNPMKVPRGTNSPKKINGRDYTGHALDQMQGRGIMPSAVDDAIRHGGVRGGVPGTTAHYSSVNNVTVITDTASGRVITVGSGRFGG